MHRRRRNRVLIWIIACGLLNFLTYTVLYAYIGGDAKNGQIDNGHYFVQGHFLYDAQGHAREVGKGVWIYSYIHSISIWPTIGMVLCSMLILARPHIIATMQEDSLLRGHSFVTISMTLIVIVVGTSTTYFVMDFLQALRAIEAGGRYGV